MKQFFKTMFASALGMILAGIILIFVLVGVIGGAIASFDKPEKITKVKDNSVLKISFETEIKERAEGGSPLENFDFNTMQPKNQLGLDKIIENIKKAKTDDRIKGIYLNTESVKAGTAALEEIRDALLDFKTSGKWIVSYTEQLSHGSYYLATVADEIYMYPEGTLNFVGLRTELMFFKGLLEKLEVQPQIIRGKNNKYKSAMEPFMYDHMSEANREQTEKFIGSLWNHMLTNISKSRGVSVDRLNEIADSVLVENPRKAVKLGLIDGTKYEDEILSLLREKLNIGEKEKINYAELPKYFDAKDPNKKLDRKKLKNKNSIAVVYCVGSIESGEGDNETIGSERIAKAIRKARLDTTVKALVLRVNSPGGSALASDVMWREVVLTKKVKPVVVSMGDVAASGGYYISCAADKIFAEETTITGSIGVFGMIPNMEKFFNNKLGINIDRVTTNKHSDMMTTFRSLDEYEHNKIQEGVEQVYDAFLSKVAEGRGMTKEEVDAIGQGRVWSGIDAKEIGLVDDFGSLEDAVAFAAEKAGVEDYKIKSLPESKDPIEELIKELKGEAQTAIIKAQLGDNFKYYQQIEKISEMKGVQMRLPYLIEVK